ncbi:SDR family oxidoreductase [Paraperlucidibaca wandonensis]|uniref:SDR family oxidoreductase n=1 Tax=Paraperlucidibaca wandonensis TaxID=1268273 RepID=A0ABW3HH42_9GAMM
MKLSSLQGKKCLITGAASGIGRATAVVAAGEGAELYLTDVQADGLEAVVAEIRAKGGQVALYQAFDIADYDAVCAFARDIHSVHGSMDVLMNIAGISIWGSIDRLQHEHWRQVIEINLMGPIHVLESFVPKMIEAGRGGHIVNVSSAAGLFGLPWHAAYSASKFGVRGISEVLRFDLAKHGIGVSLVCPGAVNTPLVGSVNIVGVDRNNPEVQATVKRFQRHAVTPEKAAQAILKGIKDNRYMVFTSPDIQVGYWFQCKFALPYELVMRLLNRQVRLLAEKHS